MKRTSSEIARAIACALALSGMVAQSVPSLAQERSASDIAQARDLFNRALDLREKGDLPAALTKLKAANTLAATPITGLELGRTYMMAGKLVDAREAFLAVGRLAVVPQETRRSEAARGEASQLAERVRARLPGLKVTISGAPLASVTVTIDGAPVPTEALTAPRWVDPGAHEIAATTSYGAKANARVELRESETREVDLALARPPAPAAATGTASALAPSPSGALPNESVPPESSALRNAFVFGGFGLAAAGVIVGSVTGVLAMNKAASVDQACRRTTSCPRTIGDDLDAGRTLGNVSTIAFAAAGAGVAAGLLGLVLLPKESSIGVGYVRPWVGAGAAGASGSFRF